ncbi:glycerol-3-phosphate dehydrogenase subunit GlpB [Desulfolutivibrio sulfoxidireducens]|uniref:glycerol-3-phosphate dehydrogenase subunit GlpB n=1 Tax=Desulfolutivibrio sulfoxidireducens TaxID=2773299 RepID=UPI00159DCFA8|nr:glycerol-3-phosphate dehydrogenase subunit GlpB [Desulfolutivibrio sulfoxidireducens]QLA16266.1 anaerobic glycerol-3-phosphate dehydrogenase subunit B [Desulfolutivibrio sulfoxidireducens]
MTPASPPRHDVDLMVLGTGLAGMAAAALALKRGLSVALAGTPGESLFASGLLDLLAVHPVAEGRIWNDPFAAVAALAADEPNHPYARVSRPEMEAAFASFVDFLAGIGLDYHGHDGKNAMIPTPVGTIKHTYRVPAGMWPADAGLRRAAPTLLVDFEGLKGFSAAQAAQTLGPVWPCLRHVRLPFPDGLPAPYPEPMALAMESPRVRESLAKALAPHLRGVEMVGFPAMLGIYRTRETLSALRELLGLPVFEIPTIPPAVTGLRLKAAFEEAMPRRGAATFFGKLALGVTARARGFTFTVGGSEPEAEVAARGAVLATGRFFGKGLVAHRKGVGEPLFGLPVVQPASRADWHGQSMFDPAGHGINRAGLATDVRFRPLGPDGEPAFETLYAVGSILAGHDWSRQKCGAGLAIVTAHAAVEDFAARK